MEHLFLKWPELAPLLQDRFILLCLDYDGTLVPIAERPSLARLSPRGREILREMVRQSDRFRVAVVSGRSLREVERFVGVPGIVYVGNHGLELEGPYLHHVHPGASDAKQLLKKICQELKKAFREFKGVFVEDKVFTLSVHYRRLDERKIGQAGTLFSNLLKPYHESSRVVVTEGKKVWEVRPSLAWNKGTTVLWLFGRVLVHSSRKVLPLYIGDDQTDEDAFKALKHKGLGVKVMEDPEETVADYFVRSPEEVLEFLNRLCLLKERRKSYGTLPFLHSGSSS